MSKKTINELLLEELQRFRDLISITINKIYEQIDRLEYFPEGEKENLWDRYNDIINTLNDIMLDIDTSLPSVSLIDFELSHYFSMLLFKNSLYLIDNYLDEQLINALDERRLELVKQKLQKVQKLINLEKKSLNSVFASRPDIFGVIEHVLEIFESIDARMKKRLEVESIRDIANKFGLKDKEICAIFRKKLIELTRESGVLDLDRVHRMFDIDSKTLKRFIEQNIEKFTPRIVYDKESFKLVDVRFILSKIKENISKHGFPNIMNIVQEYGISPDVLVDFADHLLMTFLDETIESIRNKAKRNNIIGVI